MRHKGDVDYGRFRDDAQAITKQLPSCHLFDLPSVMATTAAVRALLAPTSLPDQLVVDLLAEVSAIWLMGEPAEVLAGDLVLCHPPLGPEEVRAVAKPTASPSVWRMTVAAHDRPGLLAGLAGALADQQLSIVDAAATVLPGPGIALQRVTAVHAEGRLMEQADWDAVGLRLQAVLGRREAVRATFVPAPPVTVESQPQDLGRVVVTITAPDRVGLLWAVAAWFESHGANVETYRATSHAGVASDTFVVVGGCDCAALAGAIGGVPVETWQLPLPLRLGLRAGVSAGAVAVTLTAALAAGAVRMIQPIVRLVTRPDRGR
jgi:predicted amino acid-binding ACT domain protein